MPSDNDFAYLAGIIDGEGCIGVYPTAYAWYRATLTVGSTSKDLIVWLHDNFGGSVHNASRAGQYGNNKANQAWQMSGKKLATLLERVEPLLIIKKNQSVLAREFLSTLTKTPALGLSKEVLVRRGEIAAEFKVLNKRGLYSLIIRTLGKSHNN